MGLSERELMDNLLHEVPDERVHRTRSHDVESRSNSVDASLWRRQSEVANDQTPLLHRDSTDMGRRYNSPGSGDSVSGSYGTPDPLAHPVRDPTKPLVGLNALEIAAVANAKRFMSQRIVQRVVQDIWDGNIIFWETMSVNAVKKARVYNKR